MFFGSTNTFFDLLNYPVNCVVNMFSSATIVSLGLLFAPFVTAVVHDVVVGGSAGLVYSPQAISAAVGDQVVFQFQVKNHTVTQSSFASPCGKKDGGFDSGFMPVAANVTGDFPTYTVVVNDTEPIWVYCAQAANTASSHCGAGMVFAINCGLDGAANSFTNFKNSALAVGASLSSAAASATGSATDSPGYGYSPTTATTTTPAASSTGTASAAATTHTIAVGGSGKLTFDPPHVQANPADVVIFQFQSKNHSVTQSSFAAPCQRLDTTSTTGQSFFDSGFMPVAANSTTFPTWSLVVNDTNPVWAYCKQTNHCGAGMVFAINSVETSAKNFTAFQALAMSLNGTAANSTGSGTSSTGTSGALHVSVGISLSLAAFGASLTWLL